MCCSFCNKLVYFKGLDECAVVKYRCFIACIRPVLHGYTKLKAFYFVLLSLLLSASIDGLTFDGLRAYLVKEVSVLISSHES